MEITATDLKVGGTHVTEIGCGELIKIDLVMIATIIIVIVIVIVIVIGDFLLSL